MIGATVGRKAGVSLCGLLMPLLLGAPSADATDPTVRGRARLAVHFIVTQQQPDGSFPALSSDPIGWTADAVVTMVMARRAPSAIERALDFLETNASDVDTVGEKAKVVLAEVAGGRDPRDFAGRDLVDEIESAQQLDGRYGAMTSVFSHALAMLALEAVGGSPTLAPAAPWLVEAQCDNGGWQFLGPPTPLEDEHCSLGYADLDEANVDTTSLAVQALEVLRVPVTPRDPFAFLQSIRDPVKGGWPYDRPTSLHSEFTSKVTNANSTAMALQAYAAAGRQPPEGALRALIQLQDRLCGAKGGAFYYSWEDEDGDGRYRRMWRYNLAATIAAVPGLLRKPLPQPSVAVTRPAPTPQPC